MPSYSVLLKQVHSFGTEVIAATPSEAVSAAWAMWRERQLRGIPDAVSAVDTHTEPGPILVPDEETRRIPVRDWLLANDTTRVIPPIHLEVITKKDDTRKKLPDTSPLWVAYAPVGSRATT